jgi:hypothetical protein
MTTDVWPELDWSKTIRTPRTVLLEQSEVLKVKSKGALFLTVRTFSQTANGKFPEGSFRYEAGIFSLPPSYTLDLLAVEHATASPYPAIIFEAGEKSEERSDTEEELVAMLRDILNKPRWIQAIDRLIGMGNSR